MQLNVRPEVFTTKNRSELNSDARIIFNTVERLARSGLISAGSGHCISMCDIIQSQLKHLGIDSRIVEVDLTVGYLESDPPRFEHIGFDNLVKDRTEVDSHVVLITVTSPPILIDASISDRLPFGKLAVVEEINKIPLTNKDTIDFDFPEHRMKLTYREKSIQKIPLTHQVSILQRIETDQTIFRNLKWLKTLIVIALIISCFNSARGLYDSYQVYIADDNYWGPEASEKRAKQLNRIEQKLIELESKK